MLLTATPTDIDECSEGIVDCDHNCTNTIGSYACSCYSGYELDSINLSCSGKLNTIIFAYSEIVTATSSVLTV